MHVLESQHEQRNEFPFSSLPVQMTFFCGKLEVKVISEKEIRLFSVIFPFSHATFALFLLNLRLTRKEGENVTAKKRGRGREKN